MQIIQREQSPIRKGQQREPIVYCAAGLSTELIRMLVLPPGAASTRAIHYAPMGFVWRGLLNYFHIFQMTSFEILSLELKCQLRH